MATLFCLNSLDAKVTYFRDHGGLFGYKYVTTTKGSNGDIHVDCTEPGMTRCRPAFMDAVTPGGPILTEEIFDSIDAAVNTAINSGNLNGQLIFNSTFFVTYTYDAATDQLIVNIYSIAEAQALGLLP